MMQINANKGMTLIEVIIAMSIIAIIATYSVMSFSDLMEKQHLKSAGETIFADLRYAQSESIKRNQKVYVSFKKNGDSWCYGSNLGSDCDCTVAEQCKIDSVNKVVKSNSFKNITLQKANFAGSKTYTAFDPLKGFAVADGVKNGSIWLQSKNGTQIAIIVNRLGRVRFCSPTLTEYSNQCPTPP